MADNVGYTPGSGAIVAADEINGVLYQRIKPTFGGDGVAIDISPTNPLPVVTDRTNQLLSILQRLTKILESNMVVDSAQRQRITVDAITTGVAEHEFATGWKPIALELSVPLTNHGE